MPIQTRQTQLSEELEERLAEINKLKEQLEDREARWQEHKRTLQTDNLTGELTETEVTEHEQQTITEDVRRRRQEIETLQTGLRRDIYDLAETRQRLKMRITTSCSSDSNGLKTNYPKRSLITSIDRQAATGDLEHAVK